MSPQARLATNPLPRMLLAVACNWKSLRRTCGEVLTFAGRAAVSLEQRDDGGPLVYDEDDEVANVEEKGGIRFLLLLQQSIDEDGDLFLHLKHIGLSPWC